MNKIQKIFMGIILFLVSVALLAGLVLGMQGTGVAKAASERATDITAMTDKEQIEIDETIAENWGNPDNKQLKELTNGFKAKDIATSGDAWYYLTQDISTDTPTFSKVPDVQNGNVRIVLNGYSISGKFKLRAADSKSTVSIFDKIPGKSGTEYTYNPNPTKYYKYNSALKAYTDYSIAQPLGIDVTSMPIWKEDTYIKVTGSAFSSNEFNKGVDICYLSTNSGSLNMYGINVIGRTGGNLMIYATGKDSNNKGLVNLYQCNFIGNLGKKGYGVISTASNSIFTLIGCKVYGNQDDGTLSGAGIQPSDTRIPGKECDISVKKLRWTFSKVNMYKSNVGAIASINYYPEWRSTGCARAVYVKDVDFGGEVSFDADNVSTFFENISGIQGTIELVYRNKTDYDGNSPNLNFIVHCGDIDTEFKRGHNALKVGETGTVGNITTIFEPVHKDIIINGTAAGVSTPGNVTIGSNGKLVLKSGHNIGGTLTNNGSLLILKEKNDKIKTEKNIVNTVINYHNLMVSIKASDIDEIEQNLVGTLINYDKFMIMPEESDAVKTDKGIADTFINYGTFIIPQGVKFKVLDEQTFSGTILNKGILDVHGEVTTLINEGNADISGTVINLVVDGDTKIRRSAHVCKLIPNSDRFDKKAYLNAHDPNGICYFDASYKEISHDE